MAINLDYSYKDDIVRQRYYFRRIWVFYQKPIVRVSSALLLTIFTIIFFAVFAIRPTLITIAELVKKIEDQREVLEKAKAKSSSLATVQQQYSLIQDDLPLLDQSLPKTPAAKELIQMIEATAAFHKVPITNLRIAEVKFYSTPRSGQKAGVTSVVLAIEGQFVAMRDFLHDLSRLPRLITIESMVLAEAVADKNDTSGNLRLNLTLNAHYYPEK